MGIQSQPFLQNLYVLQWGSLSNVFREDHPRDRSWEDRDPMVIHSQAEQKPPVMCAVTEHVLDEHLSLIGLN